MKSNAKKMIFAPSKAKVKVGPLRTEIQCRVEQQNKARNPNGIIDCLSRKFICYTKDCNALKLLDAVALNRHSFLQSDLFSVCNWLGDCLFDLRIAIRQIKKWHIVCVRCGAVRVDAYNQSVKVSQSETVWLNNLILFAIWKQSICKVSIVIVVILINTLLNNDEACCGNNKIRLSYKISTVYAWC